MNLVRCADIVRFAKRVAMNYARIWYVYFRLASLRLLEMVRLYETVVVNAHGCVFPLGLRCYSSVRRYTSWICKYREREPLAILGADRNSVSSGNLVQALL